VAFPGTRRTETARSASVPSDSDRVPCVERANGSTPSGAAATDAPVMLTQYPLRSDCLPRVIDRGAGALTGAAGGSSFGAGRGPDEGVESTRDLCNIRAPTTGSSIEGRNADTDDGPGRPAR